MRIRSLVSSLALAGGLLIAPATAATATAAAHAATPQAVATSAACTYRRSGAVWKCITPGAYCPKAAHYKYGYAKVTNRRYKCSIYSNGQWRWKRAY